MTPSLARMVMARAGACACRCAGSAIPQCWRYERMTRGRRREHYQWNMDVWGEPGVGGRGRADRGDLCACSIALGLAPGDVKLRINSRALLEESLRGGVLRERPGGLRAAVRGDRQARQDRRRRGRGRSARRSEGPGRPEARRRAARSVMEMLERATSPRRRASPAKASRRAQRPPARALRAARRLRHRRPGGLRRLGGARPRLLHRRGLRGLRRRWQLRAVCGGGRYDRLLETLGGPSLPAVGLRLRRRRDRELLAETACLPELPREIDDWCSPSAMPSSAAAAVAPGLRAARAEGRAGARTPGGSSSSARWPTPTAAGPRASGCSARTRSPRGKARLKPRNGRAARRAGSAGKGRGHERRLIFPSDRGGSAIPGPRPYATRPHVAPRAEAPCDMTVDWTSRQPRALQRPQLGRRLLRRQRRRPTSSAAARAARGIDLLELVGDLRGAACGRPC